MNKYEQNFNNQYLIIFLFLKYLYLVLFMNNVVPVIHILSIFPFIPPYSLLIGYPVLN